LAGSVPERHAVSASSETGRVEFQNRNDRVAVLRRKLRGLEWALILTSGSSLRVSER